MSPNLCLGEDVVRRAHGGDEQLHWPHFAGHRVDDVDHIPSEIDEDFFAGGVTLPHGRAQATLEGAIVFAEPTVAEAARMRAAIFLP